MSYLTAAVPDSLLLQWQTFFGLLSPLSLPPPPSLAAPDRVRELPRPRDGVRVVPRASEQPRTQPHPRAFRHLVRRSITNDLSLLTFLVVDSFTATLW